MKSGPSSFLLVLMCQQPRAPARLALNKIQSLETWHCHIEAPGVFIVFKSHDMIAGYLRSVGPCQRIEVAKLRRIMSTLYPTKAFRVPAAQAGPAFLHPETREACPRAAKMAAGRMISALPQRDGASDRKRKSESAQADPNTHLVVAM